MTKRITRIKKFLEIDLWRLKLKSLPTGKRWLYSVLRIWFIAIRKFIDDRCAEKASALTFFSMLSIIPVMALLFAISKGFGIEKLLEQQINTFLIGQEEMLQNILPFARNMLKSTNGEVITGISFVFLIYTVVRLLMKIEDAFNNMWGVKKNRRWERKISDYVAVILLGPVLIIVASSATIFVTSQIQSIIAMFEILTPVKSGIFSLLKLLPYTLIWLLFFLVYLIFPNTRVKVFPALMAGILAGTLYQLTQWGFISLQFAFARYNAIYGSIVFIPLFLIWLQISWLIVLFGVEFAYGIQHVREWTLKSDWLKVSLNHKKKLMLLFLHYIVRKFENKEGAMSRSELADLVNIPGELVKNICHELERARLVTKTDSELPAYQPGFDINKMDLHTVLEMYEAEGMGDYDDRKTDAFIAVENALKEIDQRWRGSSCDKLLKDL